MPTACHRPPPTTYRLLLPSSKVEPVGFFMAEELLKARADSRFPTGSHPADETVNVYLAHLLVEHLATPRPAPVRGGGEPLLAPPSLSRRSWRLGEHYRRNGDHRLLALGLYDRADLVRRRWPGWGLDEEAARRRAGRDGRSCYELAAGLVRPGRPGAELAETLGALAAHFDQYVHVLQVLARRRFGLGTVLPPGALDALIAAGGEPGDPAGAAPIASSMDVFLDRLGAYRRRPDPSRYARLVAAAEQAGVPRGRLPDPPHDAGTRHRP